ncbi:sensor histidine kinase [Marinilabilia sp.]
MNEATENIKKGFEAYLKAVFLKNLNYILITGFIILAYYMYSDWIVRENLKAAGTRILPMLLILSILIIHLISKRKRYKLKSVLYQINYVALQFMMYGKILIHLHQDALAPSVTGAILVIFVISLDNKLKTITTALIYAFPVILFTIVLFVFGKPTGKEFLTLVDIYPILILGFIINRIQYRLRFRLFKSNYFLKLEQEKTQALYQETLKINKELDEKAREALLNKEEIQKKNEDLNKSNATKDRFLGIIAHDLKNPMSVVWSLSDVLLTHDDLNEEEKKSFLLSINNTIKHTFKLLEDLLNWARAQDKTIPCVPHIHNAHSIIEKELNVLNEQANNKSIKINNIIPSDLWLYADLAMVQTIIRNLVTNAIKYTFPNGQIEIKGQQVIIDNKEYTELAICDNGIGMSKDQVHQLFTIRKTPSSKGTNNEEGSGLGLLLCKEFMDVHKGVLKVESEPNTGSCFKCLFPAQHS